MLSFYVYLSIYSEYDHSLRSLQFLGPLVSSNSCQSSNFARIGLSALVMNTTADEMLETDGLTLENTDRV